jgi:hypothetical protein
MMLVNGHRDFLDASQLCRSRIRERRWDEDARERGRDDDADSCRTEPAGLPGIIA